MKEICISIFLTLSFLKIDAHPGVGLVYDGKETIYYTDLDQVWKLDINTGIAEIYVPNVHTHELFLDQNSNLFGEHYWYIASEEKFKHFIWKVDANGTFQKIRQDQYGENNDFSFVRDDAFASFEIRQGKDHFEIIKKDSLSETILQRAALNQPTWKYLKNSEELLFIDYPAIYSAQKTRLEIVAKDVSSKRFPFSTQSNNHNIYGIWTDKNDHIYVAIYGGRVVKKIDRNGNANSIIKSSLLWSPVNGVFDKDGNLWLMECKIGGKIRVRKIESSAITNKVSFAFENSIVAFLILAMIFFIYQKRK